MLQLQQQEQGAGGEGVGKGTLAETRRRRRSSMLLEGHVQVCCLCARAHALMSVEIEEQEMSWLQSPEPTAIKLVSAIQRAFRRPWPHCCAMYTCRSSRSFIEASRRALQSSRAGNSRTTETAKLCRLEICHCTDRFPVRACRNMA